MNVFFAPYGSFSQETGLMALFSRYLESKNKPTQWISCNGSLGACDRDEEVSWMRTHTTCLSCMADSRKLTDWIGCKVNEITPLARMNNQDQRTVNFNDIQESFSRRFGVATPESSHLGHDAFKTKLETGFVRVKSAIETYCASQKPSFMFIASGVDAASRAAFIAAENSQVKASIFQWGIQDRGIKIFHPIRKEALSCALVLTDISKYRTQVDSWSKEVLEILSEIELFLGV